MNSQLELSSLPSLAKDKSTSGKSHHDRHLHLGHFAFMRAMVQGVDVEKSWDRYLRIEGEYSDIRAVRKTIRWIREQFAAAAKRSLLFGTARLVLIDTALISDNQDVLPTLETFAAKVGMEDWSEVEQVAAYEAEYGSASKKLSRRGRIINKQLTALKLLEEIAAQAPVAGDPLSSWLNPDFTKRLESANIFTIRALLNTINGRGKNWWRSIKAIGAGKAQRLEEWLLLHQESIGLSIGPHVALARSKLPSGTLKVIVPKSTSIVPIDKFIVPQWLDGSEGLFRAPGTPMLNARNDYAAILEWIQTRRKLSADKIRAIKVKRNINPDAPDGPTDWLQYLSNTQRAYLREVERFLLWAIIERKKPISSMDVSDCSAYRSFLEAPSPSDLWCGPKNVERWSVLWRPFTGPLKLGSQRQAITILKSFYAYLVATQYLVGNPWQGVSSPAETNPKRARTRSLTKPQWTFVLGQAKELERGSDADRRLNFALHFFYGTGLRLSEGIDCKLGDFEFVSFPATEDDPESIEGYQLQVVGKGNKVRTVPVHDHTIQMLSSYLLARGLHPKPDAPENAPASLFGRSLDVSTQAPFSPYAKLVVDPKQGISASTLYDQMKKFFKQCATEIGKNDATAAAKFEAASVHWLRHTHATHAVEKGMEIDILQARLGHASGNTTMIYVTTEDRRQMKALRKLL